jgi:hypothetical protein
MATAPHAALLIGSTELRSPPFSNEWRLENGGRRLASARRHPRLHTSTVTFPDGSRLTLTPTGQSTVSAVDASGNEVARIVRTSWWGRHWEVTAQHFSYELVSHPRPRRWAFAVGGSPVAELAGSLVSYNRVRVETNIGVPLIAVLLGWHVIARPWEAAAEPGGLVPARTTRPRPVTHER